MFNPYRISWRRRLRRARRHPAVRVTVLAGLAVVILMSLATDADLDGTRSVVVATHALAAGEMVTTDAVATQDWPVELLPAGAITEPPVGRTVTDAIAEGEPFVEGRLAPAGLTGVAALVPAGGRALAVPVAAATVPLQVGDRVDLLATFAIDAESPGAPTFPVTADALVLAVDQHAITVAVPEADAARVAFAVSTGTVVPALRGAR